MKRQQSQECEAAAEETIAENAAAEEASAKEATAENQGTNTVIPGSAAVTVCITRPNSKSVWTMLLRFGYVFCITILAPDPKGHVLKNQFSS